MEHGNHDTSHHIIPSQVYFKTFAALIILTLLTVLLSPTVMGEAVHFGKLNIVLAMAVASTKATLVVLFFMGLKYDGKMNRLIFGSGIFFLVVLYGFSIFDILTRFDQSPK